GYLVSATPAIVTPGSVAHELAVRPRRNAIEPDRGQTLELQPHSPFVVAWRRGSVSGIHGAVGRRRELAGHLVPGSIHRGIPEPGYDVGVVARRLAVESLRISHLAPGRIGANLRCRYPMR